MNGQSLSPRRYVLVSLGINYAGLDINTETQFYRRASRQTIHYKLSSNTAYYSRSNLAQPVDARPLPVGPAVLETDKIPRLTQILLTKECYVFTFEILRQKMLQRSIGTH